MRHFYVFVSCVAYKLGGAIVWLVEYLIFFKAINIVSLHTCKYI